MFQGRFKGVPRKFFFSRKIEGCFNGVLSEFQGCLQEVEWVFETDNLVMLKSFLLHQQRQVSKVFQKSVDEVLCCNFVLA